MLILFDVKLDLDKEGVDLTLKDDEFENSVWLDEVDSDFENLEVVGLTRPEFTILVEAE